MSKPTNIIFLSESWSEDCRLNNTFAGSDISVNRESTVKALDLLGRFLVFLALAIFQVKANPGTYVR
ncbi:hypothetical protein C0J52_16161 [Blattella germanica]|nr:hypothetical protein C0J52_16161 [Blattella germanica]